MIGLKIKNGVVENVAVFNEIPTGWIAAPEGVGIGWADDGDGTFSPPAPDPLTQQEIILYERSWRNGQLRRADLEVYKAEDELGAFDATNWRTYRKLLRAWPSHPDFPDQSKRPVSP